MEKPPENFKQKKLEREVLWQKAKEEVDKLMDNASHPVDGGIKETLVALHLLGINTSGSCEGHLDHGRLAPWIGIETPATDEVKELEAKINRAVTTEGEEEKTEILIDQMRKLNLAERRKVVALLSEFYQGRDTSVEDRLIITGLGWGSSRLESQGADFQEIEAGDVKERKLADFQKEMGEFTEFIKKKFFEG